jgi:hypothetical protein
MDDIMSCILRATMTPAENGTFLSHLYIKTIILPRQARDKHRENSKKDFFRTIHSVLEAIPGVESLQRAERRAESQVRGRARQPRVLQQLLHQ